jgi:predicted ABC-type ATPase
MSELSMYEINLVRIRRRFIGGGHDVPEADVRRRYERSLKNLIIAAHIADFVMLFDNSTDGGYREVAMIENGTPRWFDPIPDWARPLKTSFENI